MSADEKQCRVIGINPEKISEENKLKFDEVEVVKLRRLIPASARSSDTYYFDIKANEIVRVELNNGFSLWLRADDLLNEFGKPNASRGGETAWEINIKQGLLPSSRSKRGLAGLAIKVLDFFDIDLQSKTASKLCSLWEDKLLEKRTIDLYRCSLEDTYALGAKGELDPDQPLLVFIHGTASNSQKSFGGLWEASSKSGKTAREKLKKKYGEAVYAFEHRTLTESPIQNALQLVQQLPNNAKLHLITHSRGGLVGELLCLGDLKSASPDIKIINKLFAADRTIAPQLGLDPLNAQAQQDRNKAYEADRKHLEALLTLLEQKQIKVERFVRVACPARGTTLASGRLDRWLSALNYLSGNGLLGDTVGFLLAVIKERTDPRTLPGLEAMMPGSALTSLLQDPSLVTNADLSIIAGDIEGDSILSQLKLWVTDWFYGSDHDLVVNTGSMYGGLRRLPQQVRFLCDRGTGVHHFNYFKNDKTVNWLLQGLERLDSSNGPFQPIKQAKQEQPRWRSAVQRTRGSATPRPLAVVLPGTMGSALRVSNEPVWLNYLALARGELGRLQRGAIDVEPVDLLDDFYGPLLEFLTLSHRVEIVPYDWRLSVREAAKRLMSVLLEKLPEAERAQQPVHLIAHSMGGLVVRAMIADGGEGLALWRRIIKLPKSRFLMLGTPNQGSYEAVRWLTGNNSTQAKLSLLDLTQSTNEIVNLVRLYPGLLELLPFDLDSQDFSQSSLWEGLKEQLSAKWLPPEKNDLASIRDTWLLLKNSTNLIDPKYTCYVAGCQDATVIGYRLVDCGGLFHAHSDCKRFEFLATREGDGTVSWKSGQLPGVATWYLDDTAHDDLCVRKRAFPAYLDLLMSGETTRLPKSPPGRARAQVGQSDIFVLPTYPPVDCIPDEASLRDFSFGSARTPRQLESSGVIPVIEVTIRHGDLAYAKYPVLVGHYRGDGIFSAEKALDDRLQNQLLKRIQLDLYPGEIGSHALFFSRKPYSNPTGAIVIGLGQVGDLTPGVLTLSVQNALLEYALRMMQYPPSADQNQSYNQNSRYSVEITSLLVGTGAGGMTIRDSIEAILRGAIAVNDKLVEAELNEKVVIETIEFLELYADAAITAANALEEILADGQFSMKVNWANRVIQEGQGGMSRVLYDDIGDWWRRLEIIEDERSGMLRFISTTNRARAEETLATGQLQLAENFIKRASQSTSANSEVAKTLYEMLFPNHLKELAQQQKGLVLIVDKVSAKYPWELLEDRWSISKMPPAVSAGLVRQLKTPQFRLHPSYASQSTALVIGNPNLNGWNQFTDLPGARSEAQKVSEFLNSNGFHVTDYIDASADDIVSGLHKEPWRILHLAGHGVHEFQIDEENIPRQDVQATLNKSFSKITERMSGMVIGDNILLTPRDIQQMRWVPELVFVNCCYLGKTQTTYDAPTYSMLAANLAIQFIEMGAKVVVAAGWAVDDEAGQVFAENFYKHMLQGSTFGDAVKLAREEIWLRYSAFNNTWGAYQCYGDPSYHLVNKDGTVKQDSGRKFYHSPYELINDLENEVAKIRMRINANQNDDVFNEQKDKIDQRISAIPESIREDWFSRADVSAAIGFTYGEISAWEEAIHFLEKAIEAEKGECSIKVIEQLANYRVRWVASEWQRQGQKPIALNNAMERAIKDLESICTSFPTKERFSLMGGCYKRLARMQTGKERLETLKNVEIYYSKAYEKSKSTGSYYPFNNMVTATWLMNKLEKIPKKKDFSDLLNDCDSIIAKVQQVNVSDPNFWNSVALADCRLIQLMLQDEAEPSKVKIDEIVELYQRAFGRGNSPREISSVYENFEFLLDLTPRPFSDVIQEILQRIQTPYLNK